MASFTSILKKIGQVMTAVVTGSQVLGPIINQTVPASVQPTVVKVEDKLNDIFKAIFTVETVANTLTDPAAKTGAQKLAMLIPLVQDIVASSQLVTGKSVGDPQLFTEGVKEVAEGAVKIINALHSV